MTSPDELHIKTYRSLDEAQGLRSIWDQLAAGHFMLKWNWLANWWKSLAASERGHSRRQLIIATVVNAQGHIVGIAPFYRTHSFAGSALRFLGDGAACSDYVRILSNAGDYEQVCVKIANWIASDDFRLRFGAIDWVEIEGHTPGDAGWIAFFNELAGCGWSFEEKALDGCWRMILPDTWTAYYQDLSKTRKRKVKKAVKLLADGTVTFHATVDAIEIADAWGTLVQLHQQRRKQMHQPGCFANPNFETFLKSATLDFAAENAVLLAQLKSQSQTVGCLLLFKDLGRLAMYQSGFDPAFEHLEPGHLINTFTLQYAIENSLFDFDFLRGDEHYKSGWNAERIPLFSTRVTSPQLTSRLKNSLWSAGRQLKLWTSSRPSTPHQETTEST